MKDELTQLISRLDNVDKHSTLLHIIDTYLTNAQKKQLQMEIEERL